MANVIFWTIPLFSKVLIYAFISSAISYLTLAKQHFNHFQYYAILMESRIDEVVAFAQPQLFFRQKIAFCALHWRLFMLNCERALQVDFKRKYSIFAKLLSSLCENVCTYTCIYSLLLSLFLLFWLLSRYDTSPTPLRGSTRRKSHTRLCSVGLVYWLPFATW